MGWGCERSLLRSDMGEALLARLLPSPGPAGSGPCSLGPGPHLDLHRLLAHAGLDSLVGGGVRCGPVVACRAEPKRQLCPRAPHANTRLAPISVCHLSSGLAQEALQVWTPFPWGMSGHHRTGFRPPSPPLPLTPIVASLDLLLCTRGPQAPQPRVASKPLGVQAIAPPDRGGGS